MQLFEDFRLVFKIRAYCTIPGDGAHRKIFCEMNQKAQAILGGLASIFGKYHEKFWCDTPPEPLGANCAVLPWKRAQKCPLTSHVGGHFAT
ncbi:hypothetical protein [Fournierella sp.]|uniref:hypothetical protein n=1 Tax=Allofournierella sp. TaxID=1940256 RepID=UPI0025B97DB1|nr:hypothetical protein [Fournierella sp.]